MNTSTPYEEEEKHTSLYLLFLTIVEKLITLMKFLQPPYFFDLRKIPFSFLFEKNAFVWAALKKMQEFLLACELGRIEGEIEKGAILINPETISIGKGTKVEAGAYIKGPCLIGEECEVRHGAYIRGFFLSGNRCVIGHSTEIKNAIFFHKACAGHFAYVGDSILGNHVNLGAGTKCANLRFDKEPISISIEGKKIQTELRKFGVIMGDESQTGCNAVTNPGTLVGKKSMIAPCLSVRGFISENTKVLFSHDASFSISR